MRELHCHPSSLNVANNVSIAEPFTEWFRFQKNNFQSKLI